MADYSYGDLKQMVGRKLGILADTEVLSAEDGELIEFGLASVQSQLERLNIVDLDVEHGIYEPYAEPVAAMAAAQLVDEFKVSEPKRGQLMAGGLIGLPGRSVAERRLRALVDGVTVKLQTTHDSTVI